jgi:cytochrome P450
VNEVALTTAASIPPGPRGSLLLGSLREVMRDPLTLFLDAAKAHGGVVRFRFAHLQAFLISEPAYIKRVLTENMRNYPKGASYASLRHALGDGLLVSEGELWKRQRRLLNPVFARQILRDKTPVMYECARSACERWERAAAAGEGIDLGAEMMRLAFDVVGRVVLGSEVDAEMEEVAAVEPIAGAWVYGHLRALIKVPPWVPTPNNLRYRRALGVLHDVVQRVIDRHRVQGEVPDMMTLLMSARDDETGRGMTDRQLRDEVLTFLIAGHETTGAALAWVYVLLAAHPEIERRLHAEVDAVLGDRPITPDDLSRLPYVGQVIDEAMRLYPSSWSFMRTAADRDRMGDYEIPRGAIVIISPWVNHRLPRFWPSPDTFDPDRFAPDAVKEHDTYQYFPFGHGPHLCIGKYLTLYEMKVAVATISQRHRLVREDQDPIQPATEITMKPARAIPVRLVPRSVAAVPAARQPDGDADPRRGEAR